MRNKKLLIVLILITGASLFYWFQIRPTEIRKYCDTQAWKASNPEASWWLNKTKTDHYDWKYNQCLHSQGLK